MAQIPCQKCRKLYPESWVWHICSDCGYRICDKCIPDHKKYNSMDGGLIKCDKCKRGFLKNKSYN